jgi:PKD repeat protein
VFKSTNGGGSWNAANTGLPDTDVLALAIDPQTPATLYAGLFYSGVYKSTNGGGNWVSINTGLSLYNPRVAALVIDPLTPTTLYAGDYGGGVFKSTTGGGSWSEANTGLTTTYVIDLAIDPTSPTILYAGTYDGGVFKSINGGGSWNAANTGLPDTPVYAIVIDPQTPSIIYAGTHGGGVFKSTDGGESWNAFNAGLSALQINGLAIDPQTPTTLYAATAGAGIFTIQSPLQTKFSADPISGIAPLTVTFRNESSGDFDNCEWSFGDGATNDSCLDQSHTYAGSGVFTVSLTVGGTGDRQTLTKTNLITVYEPVLVDLTTSLTSGAAPLTVTFRNRSSGDFDTCDWSFGDDTTNDSCLDQSHTYAGSGVYTVSLTASGNGGRHTLTQTELISVYEAEDRIYLPVIQHK